MKSLLKSLPCSAVAVILTMTGALANGPTLAGSLWNCTRARDGSQFLIAFYPDGGVGGGEIDRSVVSPYVFDASRTKPDQWPGRWSETGENFTWDFPDQHMRIEGRVERPAKGRGRLTGTETAMEQTSAVNCIPQTRAPRLGTGLVIPKDGHFLDPEDTEGELKVPAGISLQRPGRSR
ncbi:hypothetical protein [Microvirga puerhi]|uniref:Uncharacterized protein n=1 Tax=Microvirga puerhi TaxID=2876078 RepID=A0ABS7VUN7_9HYPH|nr:hypothetical protein [Microvirga puerhi]MBZ6078765.1 hypothetical protein [Microvirga puerhi]